MTFKARRLDFNQISHFSLAASDYDSCLSRIDYSGPSALRHTLKTLKNILFRGHSWLILLRDSIRSIFEYDIAVCKFQEDWVRHLKLRKQEFSEWCKGKGIGPTPNLIRFSGATWAWPWPIVHFLIRDIIDKHRDESLPWTCFI